MFSGNRMKQVVRIGLSSVALATAQVAVSAPAVAAQTIQVRVPAMALSDALRTIGAQAGIQIIFDERQTKGKKSPAVRGSMAAEAAVREALRGSGLKVRRGASGVLIVSTARMAPQEAAVTQPQTAASPSQQPIQTAEDEIQQETEILVTGSRIQRQVATDAPTPVVSIGIDDIQASGSTELSEILLDYPAVTTDSNLVNTVNNINAAGLSTVDLRSLGADRTLTLIDGRRSVSNRLTRNTVSLSTIPTMFVEKVEIITGGASAIYGSDAIAGVVNIITRRSYDGFKIGGRTGLSSKGDSQRYNVDALWGSQFMDDRVSVVVGASYEKEKGLYARQRPRSLETIGYSQSADLNPANQGDLGIDTANVSSTPPGGRFLSSSTAGGGYFVYDDGGDLYRSTNLATYGYNTRDDLQLSIPRESWLGAAKVRVDLGSNIEFFAHGQFSKIKTDADRGYDTASETETYGVLDEFTLGRIARNNPFVPAEIRARASSSGIQWRRRFVELGSYGSENDRETWRAWTGLKGDLGTKWNWEISYGYGRYHQKQDRHGVINLENLKYALNAEYDPAVPGDLSRVRCVDAAARAAGCVPIDVFGPGSITPAMANYIGTSMHLDGLVTQNIAQGYLSGELFQLPAGPVSVAVGAEYRRDWQRSTTDDVTRRGIGTASFIAEYSGNIKAKEAFAEISVPVLKDQPFAYDLTLDGAARVGDYNIDNVGTVFSYRFGGAWAPVEGLRFRTQFARSQRAPTITNLYSPLRDDADSVVDPCNGVTATTGGVTASNCRSIAAVAAQIAANGVFMQDTDDIKGPSAGNPNLKEETANTFTLGAVLTPRALPGFSFTVDYFKIKVKGAINALTADQLVRECYGSPDGIADNEFCDPITRDANGQITQIINQDLNLNKIVRSGIDVGMDYRFDAPEFLSADGRFDVRVLYSRLLDYYTDFNGVDGSTRTDSKGEIDAWKDQGQFQLGYSQGPLRLRWKARYTGKAVDSNIRLANAELAGSNPPFLHVGDRVRHDFYVSMDMNQEGPDMRIYAGVNNAFNSVSPFLPTGTASGGTANVSGAYDVIGRYFYAGFEAKF